MPSVDAEGRPPMVPPPGAAPGFSAGEVIGRTFAIWWRYLPAFAFAALVLDSPVIALEAVFGPIDSGHPGFRFESFLSSVVWAGIAAALTHGTLGALAGERVRFLAMLRAGVTKLFPAFLVILGCSLVISLFAIALVFPGIVAACALSLTIPALVAEPLGPSSAMRRSAALTKGSRARIFAIGATVGIAIIAAILAAGAASWAVQDLVSPRVEGVAVEVFAVVLLALFPVASAVAYHDLRRAKEGVPAAEVARVFE